MIFPFFAILRAECGVYTFSRGDVNNVVCLNRKLLRRFGISVRYLRQLDTTTLMGSLAVMSAAAGVLQASLESIVLRRLVAHFPTPWLNRLLQLSTPN